MSEIYGLDFRPKIIQEGLCMARRKVKITDFIQTCETNSRLQYLADSFMPSCSLYDVIDGNYVPPQKEKTRKKSSSRRMADADTMFIAYRLDIRQRNRNLILNRTSERQGSCGTGCFPTMN